MPGQRRVAWLPYASIQEAEQRLSGIPEGIEIDLYRADGDSWPDSIAEVEFYVLPYMKGEEVLDRVGDMTQLKVIQTLTAGVENFLPHVPENVVLCNAAGVHDTSTAELAVALALASGRHLDHYARNQPSGTWDFQLGTSLADQRVLIIGYGQIGAAIERRLSGFEVASVTRVARRCMNDHDHGGCGKHQLHRGAGSHTSPLLEFPVLIDEAEEPGPVGQATGRRAIRALGRGRCPRAMRWHARIARDGSRRRREASLRIHSC